MSERSAVRASHTTGGRGTPSVERQGRLSENWPKRILESFFINQSSAAFFRWSPPWPPRLWGTPMRIECLTYTELGDRLGTSPEAARSLARRLRLPRKPGNEGKARVTVDLTEVQYKPL